MRGDRRIRATPRHLELYFPTPYKTVPHAEEKLLFVQTQCYAFSRRIATNFSLYDGSVEVCFRAVRSPRLEALLARVAPLTERILFSEEGVTLYIKYFAEPTVKERAVKALFEEKRIDR